MSRGWRRRWAGAPLFFMTSAGALVRRARSGAATPIVSGPAGGVVGVSRTAEAAGGKPCSASTWAAPPPTSAATPELLERATTAAVAGVKLRAPMLDVETVAAGGGSILTFDGLRARVDRIAPEPSPDRPATAAAARRRSPDANLVLGRLKSRAIPVGVRPGRDAPLDPAAPARGWPNWRRRWARRARKRPPEGFLAVAVGADGRRDPAHLYRTRLQIPAATPSCPSAAAAGQVACQVAEALGSRRCWSPKYASLLSAWGSRPGVACGRSRRRVIGRVLGPDGIAAAETVANRLETEAAEALADQGRRSRHGRTTALPAIRRGRRVAAGGAGRRARCPRRLSRRRTSGCSGFIEPDRPIILIASWR